MAEPIKSANSARPGSLKKPVASENEQDEVAAMLADFDAPAAPAAAAEDDVSAMINDVAMSEGNTGDVPVVPEAPLPNEFPAEGPQGTFDISAQFRDAGVRMAGKLAGDPKSLVLTLENKVGKDNVKVTKDGRVFWKFGEDKKFREFDPDTFELYNDLLADNVKEMAQIGAGTAATAGGPLAQGAAVAGATLATDLYGKSIGVVKDDSQFMTESGSPLRPVEEVGQAIQAGAEYVVFEKVANVIGGKIKARRERLEGLRKLKEIPPSERLRDGVKANMETLEELRSLGYTQNITGTNIDVPAHQLLPYEPGVKKMANALSAERALQNAQNEAAENFSRTSLELAEEAMGLTKGRLSEVVKTGVPSEKTISSDQIKGLFNQVRQAEGAVIGEFRKLAKDTAKKNPLPSPETAKAVQEIFGKLGIRAGKDGVLKFPKDDALMQMLGTDSKAFVSGLKSDLLRLNDKLVKGGLNVDEMISLSQVMGGKNEGARRIGGQYKMFIGKLSSAIRADSRNGVAMVLSPDDAIAYQAKMARFGQISKSMEQLDSFLADDIGMNVFAKGLVNKGKSGLANLRAAKEFLLQENPEMYKNLIGEYMEELALKHRVPGQIGGFNAKAMRKELAGLGSQMLDELIPKNSGISKGLVLRSFDLAEQLQKTIISGTDKELMRDAKRAVSALSWYHRGVNFGFGLLNLQSKDARLLKLISREGVEEFLKDVPKKDAPRMREFLTASLQLARRAGTVQMINNFTQVPTEVRGDALPIYRDGP